MIVGKRERENDRETTDSYGPAGNKLTDLRSGESGRRQVGGQAVRREADSASAEQTVPPPPPPNNCPFTVTTLGELGGLVTRRSHHERPERRQGRLGPEKR